MDFSLTPVQQEIQDRARRFVDEVCMPLEAEWPLSDYDADPKIMAHLREKFTEFGFRGMAIPSEAGGKGAGTVAKCLIFEEFKRSWILFGNTVTWSAFLDPHPALWLAPAWQKEKYLQPVLDGKTQYHICISEPGFGSDVAGIETTAVRQGDHFVLNGIKRWSPDPFHPFTAASYLLVYAVTDPGKGYKGISTFLVDWPSDGIEVLNVKETASPGSFLGRVADLKFDNVKIPAENLLGELNSGFKYVQDQLNRNRTVIAAGNVGSAKRALAIAIDYAKKRESFGAPLADRQVIQFRLAEMATEIEMGRALAYKAAWKIDQGLDARVEAAMAKAYCPKIACDVMDRTIQILGGIGVLRENRLPEAYFISRMSQIAEGSVEMMKMTIAKSLLGAWD